MRHIEIVTCENCGKVFESRIHNAKYCSRACSNRRHNIRPNATFQCPHNKEVYCNHRACGTCGWNPRVVEERLDKFLGKGESS